MQLAHLFSEDRTLPTKPHRFFIFYCTQQESRLSNKIPSTVALPFEYEDTVRVRDTERDRK